MMSCHGTRILGITILSVCALAQVAVSGTPEPKNFVYQGLLKLGGLPVNNVCDFSFSLYDRSNTLLGHQAFDTNPDTPDPIPVVNGVFQVALDLGGAFESSTLPSQPWSIEVAVRCPSGAATKMITLAPPTVIEPVPMAYHAKTTEKPDGHSLDAADGSPGNALYVNNEGAVGIGTASPQSLLHLAKNASQVGVRLTAAGSWNAELRQTDSSFLSLINGGSECLTIDAGRNVGIGTTTPSARLDVVSGNDPQLELRTSDESGDDAGMIIQGARNGSTNVDVGYIELRNFDSNEGTDGTEFAMSRIGGGAETVSGQTGWLRFMTNDGGGLQERMRITADGRVGIGTGAPSASLHLANTGSVNLKLEADTDNVDESHNAQMLFSQDGGATTMRLGFVDGGNNFEMMQEQANRLLLGVNNHTMVEVTSSTLQVNNLSGQRILSLGQSGDGSGVLELYGNSGSLNVLVSNYGSDRGVVQIYDENGAAQAGMYINGSGQGVVFGDSKQFRVKNPADASTDICYTSLEGPEAAAYLRGTTSLVDGQATIELPDHFQAVASQRGITVTVTPLSARSEGLAVTEKSPSRVVVRELRDGRGNYDFDYLVMAVRRGHEDFQVIQPTRLGRPASESGVVVPPPSSVD